MTYYHLPNREQLATPTPSPVASATSGVPAGAVFPRHEEAIPANRGDQYVYGELSIAGGGLRISTLTRLTARPRGTA